MVLQLLNEFGEVVFHREVTANDLANPDEAMDLINGLVQELALHETDDDS